MTEGAPTDQSQIENPVALVNAITETSGLHVSETTRPIQSIQGLREEAKAIKLKNEKNPEFASRQDHWMQQHRVIREAVSNGELPPEEADEILGVLNAEMEMAEALDPLTELPNRRELERRMQEHLALAKRNGTPISFAFMDVDHFKTFNDTYGHEVGDAVLQQWAGYLKSMLRQSDITARWGGEEFVVLLPNTNEVDAVHVMDRIREDMPEALAEALDAMGFSVKQAVTMSVGVAQAQFSEDPHEDIATIIENLPKRADERMYQAKESGRNKVVGTPPTISL